ncbi:MAG: amino acid ABC transporter permease [Lachnospiraceae bacterium]|nr:amino acid ABC transporter permease [Lachnospiraceae bacterium]
MAFDLQAIQEYLPLYKEAFLLTVRIGFEGILIAFLLGILCALIEYRRIPVLRQLTAVYVELFRNTPLLVQLFFIYFGLPKIGISIAAETCGRLGLGLLGGAYMAEAFKSALSSVEPIQRESAISLGMSETQCFRYVILPQAISVGVPGIVANVIFLLKETSVFSAISLMDLMFTAKDLIGLYYKTTECLTLLVIFYLFMLLPVSILGSFAEKRVRYAGFGD